MTHELPELPYAIDALQPYISQETLEYHHGKHHRAYVNNLNKLISGTEYADQDLEAIIQSASGGIFNNAAQIWNHTFYWNSMAPNAGGEPTGKVMDAINRDFGSFTQFKEQFTQAAAGHFGSGWAWLTKDEGGTLAVISTANADNPMTAGKKPLLTCDVWEHAYYIDTRNNRAQYIDHFWQLVNWDFVGKNLQG